MKSISKLRLAGLGGFPELGGDIIMVSPRNSIQSGYASGQAAYVPIKLPLYDQSFCAYAANRGNLDLAFGEEPGN